MAVHAQTLVSTLVDQHPFTEEVLRAHGVPLDDAHRKMSLYALCWVRGIEIGQLLDELEPLIAAEEDATEELTPDGWTDEQRKPLQVADEAWDWSADVLTVDAPDLAFESSKS